MTSESLGLGGLGQDISQAELDFSDLFLYNTPGEDFAVGCVKDDQGALLQNDSQPPLLVVDHHAVNVSTLPDPASSQDTFPQSTTTDNLSGTVFDCLELTSVASNIPSPSPRIEITPSGDSLSSHTLEPSPGSKALSAYRECVSPASSNSSSGWQGSPLNSPCVSPPNGGNYGIACSALDLCPGLQSIHTSSAHSSPGASPRNSITDETFLQPHHQRTTSPLPHQRSRSASPQGKRCFDQAHSCQGGTPVKQRSRSPSPIPSSHDLQRPYYIHQYQAQAEFHSHVQTAPQALEEELNPFSSVLPKSGAPTGVRGTHAQPLRPDCVYVDRYDWPIEHERMGRSGAEVKPEPIYILPAVWAPTQPAHQPARCTISGLSVAPLPSLEWSLPSQSGQYELMILQQPRSHHRAHYETEGSRGAVKTPNGGHPEVQLRGYQGTAPVGLQVFIGTADEKLLKPHAFYQVHRITGKTVTTPSLERVISGTKVLEISLEPKSHMRVVIDCVGILKLRNADIELRNGETDIGRKNTRVRLVFRVHIPEPGGHLTSLQVASNPIECSQRSAQEFPAVERQDLDRCSVLGGQQMVLTGQNFTSDSKVIFSEKTQDGQQIWEVEATVDRDKTQANMLFVEVPPYRDRNICQPAKVNFYVINGKKKRSQPQHFIYTPVLAIKAEPRDDYHLDSYNCLDNHHLSGISMKSFYHHLEQDINHPTSSTLCHLDPRVDPRGHMLPPDSFDEPVYYQPRADSLMSNQVMYHTANQYYSNCSTNLPSHPVSAPSQGVSARSPMAKLGEAPQVADSFEACLVSRCHGFVTPLGKSPPSRYVQVKAGSQIQPVGQPLPQIGSAKGNHDDKAPEKITIKQENLSYAYLEDVNDIIRRDMKGHSGD